MKSIRSFPRRRRGSLLIVAMILCAIIGVSLASYLQLAKGTLEISNRGLYQNAAMNLAENGLEEVMYSINQRVANPAYSWTGWTNSGGPDAWRALPASGNYEFDQNATGVVRVYLYDYQGNAPKAIARSTVKLGGTSSPPIEKWVEVRLRKTSKFAGGIVARQQILFSGSAASVDSWKSDHDNNPTTPPVAYSTGNSQPNGLVGSTSVGTINLSNARIWGYVATGGAFPTVGTGGSVGGLGTPAGTINAAHVSTDFAANFDPIVAPTPSSAPHLGSVTATLALPRTGDMPAADGKFYYNVTDVALTDQVLSIRKRTVTDPAPKVVLLLTNALDSIAIDGPAGALLVETDAKLEIYAPGNIAIGGAGITSGGNTLATANPPVDLQFWGTKTTGVQTIELKGNGVLSAVVYAPQGAVGINGDGNACGAVIADQIAIRGDLAFHYDESLANFGGDNPFRVTGWKELLTAAERTPYTSALAF
jgi:hypothetical protein